MTLCSCGLNKCPDCNPLHYSHSRGCLKETAEQVNERQKERAMFLRFCEIEAEAAMSLVRFKRKQYIEENSMLIASGKLTLNFQEMAIDDAQAIIRALDKAGYLK